MKPGVEQLETISQSSGTPRRIEICVWGAVVKKTGKCPHDGRWPQDAIVGNNVLVNVGYVSEVGNC